jgi:hypothetical protein
LKFRLPRIGNPVYVNSMYAAVIAGIAVKLALRWLVAPAIQLANFMRWILVRNVTVFILLMGASFVTVWFKQNLSSVANTVLFAASAAIFCAGIAALKMHFDEVEEKRAAENRRKPAPKPTLFGADVPSSI